MSFTFKNVIACSVSNVKEEFAIDTNNILKIVFEEKDERAATLTTINKVDDCDSFYIPFSVKENIKVMREVLNEMQRLTIIVNPNKWGFENAIDYLSTI